MRELYNNFTTPEQSKRLLELGVPADSADLVLIREKSGDTQYYDYEFEKQALNWDEKFSDWDTLEYTMTHIVLPCWSAGRLMEIEQLCAKVPMMIEYCPIDKLVKYLEKRINDYDFSKLEEQL